MSQQFNRQRRRFLYELASTMVTSSLGVARADGSNESRALTALLNATEWLNAPRPSREQLRGKVVVVNFCTYTCINWLRTLPYIRAWARKYAPELMLIGVHTPEFAFEANPENVRHAVRRLRIEHPIVTDNDYSIWRAFDNQHWPSLYMVDAKGAVRGHHFGEGEYERSERNMQRLLTEAGGSGWTRDAVHPEGVGVELPADWNNLRSSETYLGSERAIGFAASAAARLSLNQWTLGGDWIIGKQSVLLKGAAGSIRTRFHARDLHLVMKPTRAGTAIRFRVSIDGKPPGPSRGQDVDENGLGKVVDATMYQLIRQPHPIADRLFEIEFVDAGVEAFAFTFG